MIEPTVGRVLLFTPAKRDAILKNGDQKLAAIIATVWSDTLVNLTVFDANGVATNRTSVLLIQDDAPKPDGHYCEWMEYQKGQAVKAEELETKREEPKPAAPAEATAPAQKKVETPVPDPPVKATA